MRLSGIYCIKNLINQKVYIGKSYKAKHRISAHKHLLRNNKHINIYLQRAWNKYGEEKFNFKIIEFCSIESLPEKENYWVTFYKATNDKFGYNLMIVGRKNHHHSDETKEKMKIASLGKKKSKNHVENMKLSRYRAVMQYDLESNFIKEWLGASYIRDVLGYSQSCITAVCNNKKYRKTYKGYIWKYKQN